MHHRLRIVNELAEIASDSASIEEYRRTALGRMQTALGFDFAALYSSHAGATGHHFDETDPALSTGLSACALAFSPAEVQRMSTGRAVLRDSVFTRKRRDALRDTPLFFGHCADLTHWARPMREGILGFIAVREHGRRFRSEDVSLLDAVVPIFTLAERLHTSRADDAAFAWAQDVGLTPRQAELVSLVARGLRNREIAAVLRCSELTVRNHLATTFRKAGVQTRQELVFQATNYRRTADLPGFAYAAQIVAGKLETKPETA